MDFKNIIPFNTFKKTFEASIPDEFSNKTGFSQSLVGRGLFSLIRYFKQGINLGRLEYLKRKLENEYFAGWLRFCAINKIDIKSGTMEKEAELNNLADDNREVENTQDVICEILNLDYTQMNLLTRTKKEADSYVSELEQLKNSGVDEDLLSEIDDLINKSEQVKSICDAKMPVNHSFRSILNYATSTEMRIQEDRIPTITNALDLIKEFINGKAKECPTYKLTDNEQKIINNLSTCLNEIIKNKAIEIKSLVSTNEQPAQGESEEDSEVRTENAGSGEPLWRVANRSESNIYDTVNEEFVSSKANPKVPIMQILGDSLNILPSEVSGSTSNKVNPYDYLKGIGVNNVDEIDFKACANLWANNSPTFAEKTTKFVSVDGVKKIQYAASRIIYKNRPSPSGYGEKGGGLNYDEDSTLRTAWERRVEKCKGEWRYFMNVNELDPFKLMSLQEAIRRKDANYDKFNYSMTYTTRSISDASQISEGLGLKMIKTPINENEIYVIQYLVGGKTFYIVCRMMSPRREGTNTFYLYLGNINVTKMLEDKIKEKQEDQIKREVSKYTASILDADYDNKGDKEFNNLFSINNTIKIKEGKNINSIVIAKKDFNRMTSKDLNPSSPNTNTRIFYLYLPGSDQNSPFGEASDRTTCENTTAYVYNSTNRRIEKLDYMKGLSSKPFVISKVGYIYTIESPEWKKSYFPNIDSMISYSDKNSHYLRNKIFITENIT